MTTDNGNITCEWSDECAAPSDWTITGAGRVSHVCDDHMRDEIWFMWEIGHVPSVVVTRGNAVPADGPDENDEPDVFARPWHSGDADDPGGISPGESFARVRNVRRLDGETTPVLPEHTAATCTDENHDHGDADGNDADGEPMVCHDCGIRIHYDSTVEDYRHDDAMAPGCFLRPGPDQNEQRIANDAHEMALRISRETTPDLTGDILAALRDAEISAFVQHTGGGCMAVEIETSGQNGRHYLVTNEDASLPESGDIIWCGCYTADGEMISAHQDGHADGGFVYVGTSVADLVNAVRGHMAAVPVAHGGDDMTECENGHGEQHVTETGSSAGFTGAPIYWTHLACGCTICDDSADVANAR